MNQIETKNLIREVIEELWISKYVSPKTIADNYEFDEGTVRGWCRSGKLKATKFDKDWRIKVTDWNKFVEDRTI